MCGIAGIIHKGSTPVSESLLTVMANTIKHRGPNDSGTMVCRGNGSNGMNMGLAHRRLSIIDLSILGRQPMANEDNTVFISFNGEIYNYAAIRSDLIAKGHVFRSQTDTEVLVHGYEEYGLSILDRISGMFALAIADTVANEVILARDPYGKKPLYYYESGDTLLFASELKAILAHGACRPLLNMQSVSRYLSFEYVPAPHSIFANISKVPAGSYIRILPNECIVKQYWDISFSPLENTIDIRNETAVGNEVVRLLRAAIVKRLMADVPLGVFLSGGIDSSACVALLASEMDTRNLKTFSIGFDDASFDESAYAKQVATQFHTEHHHKVFTAHEMLDILPVVLDTLDEPFADASILPTALLSRFTKEHVAVALGGDGGDELFAGYDPFVAHKLARYLNWIPGSAQNFMCGVADLLPVSHANMSFDFKIKQFLKGMPYSLPVRNQVWLGAFSKQQLPSILSKDSLVATGMLNVYDHLGNSPQSCRGWLDSLIYEYCKFYLAEDILTKVDRASMAFSLEVRTPFLDKDFSRFVHSLPAHYKLRGFTRKYILKKSLSPYLPDSILYRRKKGFGIPLSSWIRKELRPQIESVLSTQALKSTNIFSVKNVRTLLDEHYAGVRDNRKQIWTLFMFESWRQRFCTNCTSF